MSEPVDVEQQPERVRRLTLSEVARALLERGGGEHSSVKLTRNAKGDTQIEVSVRSASTDAETVDEAAAKARELYDALCETYRFVGAGGS